MKFKRRSGCSIKKIYEDFVNKFQKVRIKKPTPLSKNDYLGLSLLKESGDSRKGVFQFSQNPSLLLFFRHLPLGKNLRFVFL